MSNLLRIILLLALFLVGRGVVRAWREDRGRARVRQRAARTGRYGNLSDQDVSDADFEEIPQDK
ncbi:MAG: hypothetical protein IPK64_09680 [bacterium]|nr:hypothetical protein [bacterium]